MGNLLEFVEAKYYELVEAINKVVPIQGLVDGIDKSVPSFYLFLAVIFFGLIAVLGLGVYLFLFLEDTPLTATVLVKDLDGAKLEGIEFSLLLKNQKSDAQEKKLIKKTDVNGAFSVEYFEKLKVLEVKSEGFEDLNGVEFGLSIEKPVTIYLTRKTSLNEKIKIIVEDKDSRAKLDGSKAISIELSCEYGIQLPQSTITSFQSLIELPVIPKGCGALSAEVKVEGYSTLSKVLSSGSNVFQLEKQQASLANNAKKGTIIVKLVDSQGKPLTGITVNLVEDTGSTSSNVVGTQESSESGTVSFSNMPTGSYKAFAFHALAEFSSEDSSFSFSDASKPFETTIVLTPVPENKRKQIFVKIVDANSNSGIQAQLDVFTDAKFSMTSSSDAEGKFSAPADADSNYSLLVRATNYVNKIVKVKLVLKSVKDPEIIKLEKALNDLNGKQLNYGKVNVLVQNTDKVAVEGVNVLLFNSLNPGIPIVASKQLTGKDGRISFSNLPLEGEYFAEASNQTASGKSSKAAINSKTKELDLNVSLVLASGAIQVELVDDSGNKVSGALVKFVNCSDNELLASVLTDSDGRTVKKEFKIDKQPFILVDKNGFLSFNSFCYSIGKNESIVSKIVLTKQASLSKDFDLKLIEVQSLDRKRVSSILPSNEYFLLFNLFLRKKPDSTKIHFRMDRESTPLNELVAVLKESDLLGGEKGVLSTEFVSGSPFTNSKPSNLIGRQINFKNSNLREGVYEFGVRIKVDENTDNNSFKVRFQGEADFNGIKSEIDLTERGFVVGKTIFCDARDPKCPKFAFSFHIKGGVPGSMLDSKIDPKSQSFIGLEQGITYSLEFSVLNQTEQTFNNVGIIVTADNANKDFLGFDSKTFSSGSVWDPRQSKDFKFDFTPQKTSTPSIMDFNIKVNLPDNKETLRFNVLPKRELKLEILPEKLFTGISNNLVVRIKDDKDQLISFAQIKLKKGDNDFSSGNVQTFTTNSSGFVSIVLDNLQAGDKYFFKALKVPFKEAEKSLEVASKLGGNVRFSCVDIGLNQVQFIKGAIGRFEVINNCSDELEFKLEKPLYAQGVSISFSPETFKLLKAGKQEIEVRDATNIGFYEILVNIKKAADTLTNFNPAEAKLKEVLVETPPGQSSCFSLNKFKYNITLGQDKGKFTVIPDTATNQCFKYTENHEMPKVEVVRGLGLASLADRFAEQNKLVYYDVIDNDPNKIERKVISPPSDPEYKGVVNYLSDSTFTELPPGNEFEFPILKEGAEKVFINAIDLVATDDQRIGYSSALERNMLGELTWCTAPNADCDPLKGKMDPVYCYSIGACDAEGRPLAGNDIGDSTPSPYLPNGLPSDMKWLFLITNGDSLGINFKSWFYVAEKTGQNIPIEIYWPGGWSGYLKIDEGTPNEGVINAPGGRKIFTLTQGWHTLHGTIITPAVDCRNVTKSCRCFSRGCSHSVSEGCYKRVRVCDQYHSGYLTIPKTEPSLLSTKVYSMIGVDKNTELSTAGHDIKIKPKTDWQSIISTQLKTGLENSVKNRAPYFSPYFRTLSLNAIDVTNLQPLILLKQAVGGVENYFFNTDCGTDYKGKCIGAGVQSLVNGFCGTYYCNEKYLLGFALTSLAGGYPVKDRSDKIMISTYSDASASLKTKLHGVLVDYLSPDKDHQGLIDFSLLNRNAPGGDQFALLKVQDTLDNGKGGIKTGQESFHVKVSSGEAATCFSSAGLKGTTGKDAKPLLEYNWDWQSISLDKCDTANPEFKYCDAVQFNIMLAKRLNEIKKLYTDVNSQERFKYANFTVALMKDGYSEDLLQDFVSYYKNNIAVNDVPDWFYASDDGVFKIMQTPSRFKIVDINGDPLIPLKEPGLYSVDMDFNFDDKVNQLFFVSGNPNPNVSVTITLNKVGEIPANNPLYSIPFDGMIGFDSSTGKFKRTGYGIPLTGTGITLVRSSKLVVNANEYENPDYDAVKFPKIRVDVNSEINALNNSSRGKVFSFDSPSRKLVFSPSNAAPILMGMQQKADKASQYYFLKKSGTTPLISLGTNGNVWSGTGSTMTEGTGLCKDFKGALMPLNQKDVQASLNAPGSCALRQDLDVPINTDKVYGFNWNDTRNGLNNDSMVFLQSIFYTPINEKYNLYSACNDLTTNPNNLQLFQNSRGEYLRTSQMPNQTTELPLHDSSLNFLEQNNSLSKMMELIEQQMLCVSNDGQKVEFFWNESELFKALNEEKAYYNSVLPGKIDFTCK